MSRRIPPRTRKVSYHKDVSPTQLIGFIVGYLVVCILWLVVPVAIPTVVILAILKAAGVI